VTKAMEVKNRIAKVIIKIKKIFFLLSFISAKRERSRPAEAKRFKGNMG
jgi:uncharacterized membrane protein YqhA